MIVGIGSDLVRTVRIAATLQEQGDRFVARCFAPTERDYVEARAANLPEDKQAAARASGYAKRWAAKEACAKALGLGIRDGIYLRDIIIDNDSTGKPTILLEGGAAGRLAEITPADALPRIDVSLSDDDGLALAFVVISATPNQNKKKNDR